MLIPRLDPINSSWRFIIGVIVLTILNNNVQLSWFMNLFPIYLQIRIKMKYRYTFQRNIGIWWAPALNTVLLHYQCYTKAILCNSIRTQLSWKLIQGSYLSNNNQNKICDEICEIQRSENYHDANYYCW